MYVPSACEFLGDHEWAVDLAPASISCSLQKGLLFGGRGYYHLLNVLDPAHPLMGETEAILVLQSHPRCDLCDTGAPVPHKGETVAILRPSTHQGRGETSAALGCPTHACESGLLIPISHHG